MQSEEQKGNGKGHRLAGNAVNGTLWTNEL